MRKSNVRKLTPKEQLTPAELQRVAEKSDLEFAFYSIKQVLFTGTLEADAAQREFQANAFRNRGKLLLWHSERG